MRDVSRRKAREFRMGWLNERGFAGVEGDRLEDVVATMIDAAVDEVVNTPLVNEFLAAVEVEAVHQIERWGEPHDRMKSPADWYWLIGWLAGKAVHMPEKRRHHIVSSAAALYNWFKAESRPADSGTEGREGDHDA